jgi:hypothetical protein
VDEASRFCEMDDACVKRRGTFNASHEKLNLPQRCEFSAILRVHSAKASAANLTIYETSEWPR